MATDASLYWHDYETFGTDPVFSRASQFAGVRTDSELNVVGEPLQLYCRPSDDFIPSPMACVVTGISPQLERIRIMSPSATPSCARSSGWI